MRTITALEIAVAALGAMLFAGVAPPAQADENPYHPSPIPVTETAGHGHGTYCVEGRKIIGWTCDQELSAGGGTGTVAAVANLKDIRVPKPPCHPKGGETAGNSASRRSGPDNSKI